MLRVRTSQLAGWFRHCGYGQRKRPPLYVEAINTDLRYQLTPLGAPAPGLHLKQELSGGRFVIAGAAAGQKVCWQLSGNRKDAFAAAHPLVVERDKPDDEKGLYRHPEVHGQPEEKGIDFSANPAAAAACSSADPGLRPLTAH